MASVMVGVAWCACVGVLAPEDYLTEDELAVYGKLWELMVDGDADADAVCMGSLLLFCVWR